LLIVAGLNLAQLQPHVWDESSPYYLKDLKAVMISYAQIHQSPKTRKRMMVEGIRSVLNIPEEIKIFLDNGAFSFSMKGFEAPVSDFEEFSKKTNPDWKPIPKDFIPTPKMSIAQQKSCFRRTMKVNIDYNHNGYVPVIHISRVMDDYIREIKGNITLHGKKSIALGGIVPNLLRSPKALSHNEILKSLITLRKEFPDHNIHIFGIGGISTLHLASLLDIDSADSSGWRNRAARGIILLPGKSERTISDLGSWNGRKLDLEEEKILQSCKCPACQKFGYEGLKLNGSEGFCIRATHNLWTLLQEEKWIQEKFALDTYFDTYQQRVDKSAYRVLIDYLVQELQKKEGKNRLERI
jgi:7-cyano-7-deazaguanine tRNA-ribosyltransferase